MQVAEAMPIIPAFTKNFFDCSNVQQLEGVPPDLPC